MLDHGKHKIDWGKIEPCGSYRSIIGVYSESHSGSHFSSNKSSEKNRCPHPSFVWVKECGSVSCNSNDGSKLEEAAQNMSLRAVENDCPWSVPRNSGNEDEVRKGGSSNGFNDANDPLQEVSNPGSTMNDRWNSSVETAQANCLVPIHLDEICQIRNMYEDQQVGRDDPIALTDARRHPCSNAVCIPKQVEGIPIEGAGELPQKRLVAGQKRIIKLNALQILMCPIQQTVHLKPRPLGTLQNNWG